MTENMYGVTFNRNLVGDGPVGDCQNREKEEKKDPQQKATQKTLGALMITLPRSGYVTLNAL